MIFYLNVPIKDLQEKNDNSVAVFFQELIQSSIHGKHLIIISRKNCEWALLNISLNEQQKARLSSIKEDYTQNAGILRHAKCFMNIEIGNATLAEQESGRYEIGHCRLLESRFLDNTEFLVENAENDAEFYDLIFSKISKYHLIRSYKFDIVNGGGSTTAVNFRRLIFDKRVVVCLTDSDRDSPSCRPADTFRNTEQEARKQKFVGTLFCTLGKEAENHIPLEILIEHGLAPNANAANKLKELKDRQVVTDSADCLWLYFDVKDGVKSEKLLAKTAPEYREWLLKKYPVLGDGSNHFEIFGFGPAILRRFLECHTAVRDFVLHMRSPEWENRFGDLFDTLYWYFVAEKRTSFV